MQSGSQLVHLLAFAPKSWISKKESNGHSTTEGPNSTSCKFKKWLHFISYFIATSLTFSWPKKSMTHFNHLNLGFIIKAKMLWTLAIVKVFKNHRKGATTICPSKISNSSSIVPYTIWRTHISWQLKSTNNFMHR